MQLWFCEAHIQLFQADSAQRAFISFWNFIRDPFIFKVDHLLKKRNQNDWLTWQLHINYRQLHNWIAFKHSFIAHILFSFVFFSFVFFSFCKLRLHVRRQNEHEKREEKIYSQHVFRWDFIAHSFLIFQLNQRLIEAIACLQTLALLLRLLAVFRRCFSVLSFLFHKLIR